MPRLLVGNFDFEYSLGKRPLQQLPQKLEQINARWLIRMLPLAEPGDYVWLPAHIPTPADDPLPLACQQQHVQLLRTETELPRGAAVELLPWGWAKSLINWGERFGWTLQPPDLSVVAWANSRATSFQLEQEFACDLTDAARLETVSAVQQHLERLCADQRWVIKAEFGMSARERIVGQGTTLQSGQLQWITRRLQIGEPLFFEPWLQRISECSFHYHLSPAGEVQFLGLMELLTDDLGRYQENRVLPATTLQQWPESRKVTQQAALRMADRGYFGPLSIDCMRYLDPLTQQPRERPLQDINARWTMGRCAWEAARNSNRLVP